MTSGKKKRMSMLDSLAAAGAPSSGLRGPEPASAGFTPSAARCSVGADLAGAFAGLRRIGVRARSFASPLPDAVFSAGAAVADALVLLRGVAVRRRGARGLRSGRGGVVSSMQTPPSPPVSGRMRQSHDASRWCRGQAPV